MIDLVNYGSVVGVLSGAFLIWVSNWMGKQFEQLQSDGEKVGEKSAKLVELGNIQNKDSDTSCGVEEEGQAPGQMEISNTPQKK
jgi:hypothetical protein